MNQISRLLFTIATVLLLGLYVLPIWSIDLAAPQYPEGIGLRIYIDDITGANPNDLQNINRLNHYIGMKSIHPDSIPELSIMPFAIGFFVVLGLAVSFTNRRIGAIIWIVLFVLLLIVGLVDFYFWEYDYGHNLDPDAPLKVPGMNYQPPLIGSKQLLNMTTTSLPASGGYLAGFSILLSLFAVYYDFKIKRKELAK